MDGASFTVKHVVQVDTYDTLQNAVMATKDSSETADLNAYVSDAKAVLMSDAKTTVNTGDSTSSEPSDTQDPCDEFVNLTINKVWKISEIWMVSGRIPLQSRFPEAGQTQMERNKQKLCQDMKTMW